MHIGNHRTPELWPCTPAEHEFVQAMEAILRNPDGVTTDSVADIEASTQDSDKHLRAGKDASGPNSPLSLLMNREAQRCQLSPMQHSSFQDLFTHVFKEIF